MTDPTIRPRTRLALKVERPRLHKVILINDDYTPREFVVTVLKAEFRMSEDEAHKVMITAHRKGSCVVAVYTQDVANPRPPALPKPAVSRATRFCSPPSLRSKEHEE
jgi:ATP-dependent Clp protease adaptor protein ClpS